MKNRKEEDTRLYLSNRTSIIFREFLEEVEDENGYWSYPEPNDELKKIWNGFIEENFRPYDDGDGTVNEVFVEGLREQLIEDIQWDYVNTQFRDYIESNYPKIDLDCSLENNTIVEKEG